MSEGVWQLLDCLLHRCAAEMSQQQLCDTLHVLCCMLVK